MKNKSVFSVLAAVAAFVAWAAVPVEFKVETDHADCLYRCGEKASFTITVTGKDGKKLSEGRFKAKLDNFGEKVLAESEVDLAQGNPFTVAAEKDTPGFMRLSICADEKAFTLPKTAGQGTFHWGVAYEPEKIRPGAENPADFDSFWADASSSSHSVSNIPVAGQRYSLSWHASNCLSRITLMVLSLQCSTRHAPVLIKSRFSPFKRLFRQ